MHAQHITRAQQLQACVVLLVQPLPCLPSTATAGDEHVAQSPYPLRVLPARPTAKCCAVEGSGRSAAVAGRPAEFVVEVCDEYGNRWEGAGGGRGALGSGFRQECCGAAVAGTTS